MPSWNVAVEFYKVIECRITLEGVENLSCFNLPHWIYDYNMQTSKMAILIFFEFDLLSID